MRPLVGLSACLDPGRLHRPGCDYHYLNGAYAHAIEAAGGTPVLLPPTGIEVVARLDALVVTGGDDLDPALYGAEPVPGINLEDPRRVVFDRLLLDAAGARDLPVLAVCYGMQLLCVHLGGTLHQALPDQPTDHGAPGRGRPHPIRLAPGFVADAHGGAAEISPVSAHRQGVDRLPAGLQPTGWAPDGLVEAVEVDAIVGVQWHPEASDDGLALYRALVQTA